MVETLKNSPYFSSHNSRDINISQVTSIFDVSYIKGDTMIEKLEILEKFDRIIRALFIYIIGLASGYAWAWFALS